MRYWTFKGNTLSTMPLTSAELRDAKVTLRLRINSLKSDVVKCLSAKTPGIAYFPAVLYAFATLDYFSSLWSGWNKAGKGRSQTARMVSFLEHFLSYRRKEAQIAIDIWRHKLMHTSEPRVVENAATGERYVWSTGRGRTGHMRLVPTGRPNEYRLHFSPLVFSQELRAAVFGPNGYFEELSSSPDLQIKWRSCNTEFENYSIKLKP
jgi:hypothetical protein